MNVKRIVLSAIIIWVVSAAWTMLTCGWLFNWVYQIPPVIWKTGEEIMSAGSYAGSSVLGLLITFIFVTIFAALYKGLPFDGVKKGLMYGFIIWLVGTFSGMVTLPFYMTIAWTVIIYWLINGLVIHLIFGALVGWLYKEK